jgi:lipopolysaccharide/colanic/teichoic acid biosynthesis glycosyltransferase
VASREYHQIISRALHQDLPRWNFAARVSRRAFEALCSLVGLVLLAPLFATIVLAIKLDDGGPVFYLQDRAGKVLRRFRVMKFKSMFANCAGGSLLTARHDARITRVGHILRKYKLDELPQLVEVLKGDMQLVSARPQVEKFFALFRDEYEELLQTPPGITSIASLSFRNEERLMHESPNEEKHISKILPIKLEMLLNHSRTRTFFSDLEIIFRTVLCMQSPASVMKNGRNDSVAQALSKFISGNLT